VPADRVRPEPVGPAEGLGVLHLFCRVAGDVDLAALLAADEEARKDGCQVVSVAMLGHKAEPICGVSGGYRARSDGEGSSLSPRTCR
jgi:hypothetical protein